MFYTHTHIHTTSITLITICLLVENSDVISHLRLLQHPELNIQYFTCTVFISKSIACDNGRLEKKPIYSRCLAALSELTSLQMTRSCFFPPHISAKLRTLHLSILETCLSWIGISIMGVGSKGYKS